MSVLVRSKLFIRLNVGQVHSEHGHWGQVNAKLRFGKITRRDFILQRAVVIKLTFDGRLIGIGEIGWATFSTPKNRLLAEKK